MRRGTHLPTFFQVSSHILLSLNIPVCAGRKRLIELLTVLISLTLAVTGVFLYRDYVRFLKGAYLKRGKVVSVQATFSHFPNVRHGKNDSSYNAVIPVAYHPVVEYVHEGEAIRFTAIDHQASAKLHVGDKVQLRIINTRRKNTRACKSLVTLITLIALLGLTLLTTAIIGGTTLSLQQIFLGSFVIGLSLAILALYLSDQDQQYVDDLKQTKRGYTQLFLAEPTAYKKWQSSLRDPAQRFKIKSSQLCGATFIGSAITIMALSFKSLFIFAF